MRSARILSALTILALTLALMSGAGAARPDDAGNPFDYWTAERIASAVPRDLVIDERGLGYLRSADGRLTPYGHAVAPARTQLVAQAVSVATPVPFAKPGSDGSDSTPPSISGLDPADGASIGTVHTFSAVVTDESGLKSVAFTIAGTRFTPSCDAAGVCTIQISFNGTGSSSWTVTAKDNGAQGGNTATESASFTVGSGGGGGSGGDVTNAPWTGGGAVQTAAGRILFTMPDGNYVCSGTVVTELETDRSIILTAAHCVYDDVNKVFASKAIFIPNQDATTGAGTDFDCSNDPLGCWAVDHGVVDVEWTTRTFPDNIPWDYGYYVVDNVGSHDGATALGALDDEAGSLPASFSAPTVGDVATALGYSYSDDPNFMYCQEAMGTNGTANYWLPNCDLSGGSSGGPWQQGNNDGNDAVFSVNSWGYTRSPGMAGPKLHDNSAQALFAFALDSTMGYPIIGHVVNSSGGLVSTGTSTTTSTTVAPTTTTTIGGGGGSDSFTTEAINNGGTWTAVVRGPNSFSGTWSDGNTCVTSSGECRLSTIPKRVGSVTFTPVGGTEIAIAKP